MHPKSPQVNPLRATTRPLKPRWVATAPCRSDSLRSHNAASARKRGPFRASSAYCGLFRHSGRFPGKFSQEILCNPHPRSPVGRRGARRASRLVYHPADTESDSLGKRVLSSDATGALGDGAFGGMYWLIEGGTACAQHLGRVSDHGRFVANRERVALEHCALEHYAGSTLHHRRRGKAGSGSVRAG